VNYELSRAEAIAEARRGGEEGEAPVGAVAVLDDAMIGRDHDRMQLQRDPTAHAVLLTIQAAARKLETRRLSDVTIFTTHEPCTMCVGALVEAQVRALVFAVPDERRGAAGSVLQLARDTALPHQMSVVSGVREAEARRLGDEQPATA
jgi:tRNA(adenine34) deaminase